MASLVNSGFRSSETIGGEDHQSRAWCRFWALETNGIGNEAVIDSPAIEGLCRSVVVCQGLFIVIHIFSQGLNLVEELLFSHWFWQNTNKRSHRWGWRKAAWACAKTLSITYFLTLVLNHSCKTMWVILKTCNWHIVCWYSQVQGAHVHFSWHGEAYPRWSIGRFLHNLVLSRNLHSGTTQSCHLNMNVELWNKELFYPWLHSEIAVPT